MSFQIRPLSYSLGAEIIGIDLRDQLDDGSFGEIHSAFLKYLVLLFRGQRITREQHMTFSRRFGDVETQNALTAAGAVNKIEEYPEIVLNRQDPTKPSYATPWHSDGARTLVPSMVTLLRGVVVPEVGGDTMFSNMYAAYETLSEGMKKLIDGLFGVQFRDSKRRSDKSIPVAQPLVRVHPETGLKALFVVDKVELIAGMTKEESAPILEFLLDHAKRPQFVYRHQWRNDDLLVWDNRCTLHIGLGDYDRTSNPPNREDDRKGNAVRVYL